MARALICSTSDLGPDLGPTPLWRAEVERQVATGLEEAQLFALAARPDIVVVDSELPRAERLVAALREDAATRALSIAVLARGDFEPAEVDLLEAGANAILRLPPGPEWGERLQMLMSVPVRTDVRLSVALRVIAFSGPGEPHGGLALNVSPNGMLIETQAALRPGDDLELEFALPDGEEPLRHRARVVRLAGARQAGIRFLELAPEARARLERFVESGLSL